MGRLNVTRGITQEVFKSFLQYIGLKDENGVSVIFHDDIHHVTSFDGTESIIVGIQLKASAIEMASEQVPFKKQMTTLENQILASTLVTDHVHSIKADLENAKSLILDLDQQIKELTKYKNHFELEKEMRQPQEKA